MANDHHLTDIQANLAAIVGAILQHPSRSYTRRALTIVMAKMGGVAVTGGISGLIVALGSASTGTAIASLSGAAASTATLYWIGSLFGLGVFGGTMILSGVGVVAGIGTVLFGRRYVFGKVRQADQLEEFETTLVAACLTVLKAIDETKEEPTLQEIKILTERFLMPVFDAIDNNMKAVSGDQKTFNDTLATLPLRKLKQARNGLARIASEVQALG